MTDTTDITRMIDVALTGDESDGMPFDKTVTITVNPLIEWPGSIRVALLYLAWQNAHLIGRKTLQQFRTDLTAKTLDLTGILTAWAGELNKDNDPFTVLKFLSRSPKPVTNRPPFSRCPSCDAMLWPAATLQADETRNDPEYWNRLKQLMDAPYPHYCLNCGQRFRIDGMSIDYKATAFRADLLNDVKAAAAYSAHQPSFDDIDATTGELINQ